MSADSEHVAELLRLIKGAPQPEVSVPEIARRMGIRAAEAEELVERLIHEGRLLRDGDRLVVVEHAAWMTRPDEPIP
jgi:DNA-binding IclR family transcriptional regulator